MDLGESLDGIKRDMDCKRKFSCLQAKDESEICKAKDHGWEGFIECLEEIRNCGFFISFGKRYFCTCPIRIMIARSTKKKMAVKTGPIQNRL